MAAGVPGSGLIGANFEGRAEQTCHRSGWGRERSESSRGDSSAQGTMKLGPEGTAPPGGPPSADAAPSQSHWTIRTVTRGQQGAF